MRVWPDIAYASVLASPARPPAAAGARNASGRAARSPQLES